MAYTTRDQSKPRIVPTDRLSDLCAEYRINSNKTQLGLAQLLAQIGRLPQGFSEQERLEILAKLETMRPHIGLLERTESYLRYNRNKLEKNRQYAREHPVITRPDYIPPSVHDHIPEDPQLTGKQVLEIEDRRHGRTPKEVPFQNQPSTLTPEQKTKIEKQAQDSIEHELIQLHGQQVYNLFSKHRKELEGKSVQEIMEFLFPPDNPSPDFSQGIF